MRDHVKRLYKQKLGFLVLSTSNNFELIQNQMIEFTGVKRDSYIHIDMDTFMCGTVACVFLIAMQEKSRAILRSVGHKTNKNFCEEAQLVWHR